MKSNLEKATAGGLKADPESSVKAHIQKGGAQKVSIGKYSILGHQSYIATHCPINSFDRKDDKVIIEDCCWVGSRAVILPGTILAHGVILGAGAVIKGETLPFGIYVGNPARLLRGREASEVLRTITIRWIMQKSLDGKVSPDFNLLQTNHIKHIFQLPRFETLGVCDPLFYQIPWTKNNFTVQNFLNMIGAPI